MTRQSGGTRRQLRSRGGGARRRLRKSRRQDQGQATSDPRGEGVVGRLSGNWDQGWGDWSRDQDRQRLGRGRSQGLRRSRSRDNRYSRRRGHHRSPRCSCRLRGSCSRGHLGQRSLECSQRQGQCRSPRRSCRWRQGCRWRQDLGRCSSVHQLSASRGLPQQRLSGHGQQGVLTRRADITGKAGWTGKTGEASSRNASMAVSAGRRTTCVVVAAGKAAGVAAATDSADLWPAGGTAAGTADSRPARGCWQGKQDGQGRQDGWGTRGTWHTQGCDEPGVTVNILVI